MAPDRFIEDVRALEGTTDDGAYPALEQLIAETAAEIGLSVEALASRSRSRLLGRARCVVAERATQT